MKNKLKITNAAIILFLLTLSGCEESKSNREIWISHGISSYSMDQKIICFCMHRDSIFVVQVVNDTIHAVINQQTNQPVLSKAEFYSISDLFDLIDQAYESKADIVKVKYDDTYGFPEHIEIDYSYRAADDEITVNVSNFRQN